MSDGKDMQVRALEPNDAGPIQSLLHQLGYAANLEDVVGRINEALTAHDHFAYVAELNTRIVGVVHFYRRPALEKPLSFVIQSLVVDESARNLGVGAKLVDVVLDTAARANVECVMLTSNVRRKEAHRFYQKLGFEVSGESFSMIKRIE